VILPGTGSGPNELACLFLPALNGTIAFRSSSYSETAKEAWTFYPERERIAGASNATEKDRTGSIAAGEHNTGCLPVACDRRLRQPRPGFRAVVMFRFICSHNEDKNSLTAAWFRICSRLRLKKRKALGLGCRTTCVGNPRPQHIRTQTEVKRKAQAILLRDALLRDLLLRRGTCLDSI
jgi:hypothetical protein